MLKIVITNKTVQGEENLINTIGEKALYIIAFLDNCMGKDEYSKFTIEEIILDGGYKVDNHKGKSIDQFKTTLINLIDNGIISNIDKDTITKAKKGDLLKCKLTQKFNTDEEGNINNYFLIENEIFHSICNNDKLDTVTALNIYCNILSRINLHDTTKYCYPTNELIMEELNVSKPTLIKYLNLLQEYKLLYFGNIGKVEINNKFYNAGNVYTIEESELNKALNESNKYYLENGYNTSYISTVSDEEAEQKFNNEVSDKINKILDIQDNEVVENPKQNIITKDMVFDRMCETLEIDKVDKHNTKKVNELIKEHGIKIIYEAMKDIRYEPEKMKLIMKKEDIFHRTNYFITVLKNDQIANTKQYIKDEEREKIREENISDRERENRIIESESLENEEYYDCSQQLEDLERENRKIEAMQNNLSMDDMFSIQESMY